MLRATYSGLKKWGLFSPGSDYILVLKVSGTGKRKASYTLFLKFLLILERATKLF